MANLYRTHKRVHAIRRAPDGSAFEKCRFCGVSVAIALADMHECGTNVKVKRFKGVCEKPNVLKQSCEKPNVLKQSCKKPYVLKQSSGGDQIRSPFRFFMERFVKTCKSGNMIDIDRKGFETWKNMSDKKKQPYFNRAEKVYAAHRRALFEEVNNMIEVDDEADSANSAIVEKVDELAQLFGDSEDDEEAGLFWDRMVYFNY